MKNEVYILKVQIAEFPKNSIVVHDTEWNEWYISDKVYGARSTIAEAEICLLFNFLAEKHFNSMLEKKDA